MKQIVSILLVLFLILGGNFSVFATDDVPSPQIKNVSITEDEVLPGQRVHIQGEYNFSNINTNFYSRGARLKNIVSGESIDINLNIDPSTSTFYVSPTITGMNKCGTWGIDYIYLADSTGKRTYFYKSE